MSPRGDNGISTKAIRAKIINPFPEDAVLEGRGIRVSKQLGHIPGTGWGPRTPKGMRGTPSDQVGRGSWGE